MISRLSKQILSPIPDVRTCLALVMILGAVLGVTSAALTLTGLEMGRSQGWIQRGSDPTMGVWISAIAMYLAILVVVAWMAGLVLHTVERALVLAESDAAEPLEREPLWIAGTDYRADCAVGQLRPWGCAPVPMSRSIVGRSPGSTTAPSFAASTPTPPTRSAGVGLCGAWLRPMNGARRPG